MSAKSPPATDLNLVENSSMAQGRNHLRRVVETADAANTGIQVQMDESKAARPNLSTLDGQQAPALMQTRTATSKVFSQRINESASSSPLQKKTTVFRQYTNSGESIEELEDTPQKRQIDQLMGRTAAAEQTRNGPMESQKNQQTEQKDKLSGLLKATEEHVYKTSSAGAIQLANQQNLSLGARRGDKILVSNAQSREFTESLVSMQSSRGSPRDGKTVQFLQYSDYSPTKLSRLPVQSKNRFEDQMKQIQRKQARERRESDRLLALQSKKMLQHTRPKYFKPGEFISNASCFNKRPLDKQYRQNSTNMVEEAKMKLSLQETLKKTDVWRKDTLTFKLNGAGASNIYQRISGGASSNSLNRSQGGSRTRNYESVKGHNPTITVRDKNLFTQVNGVSETVTALAQNAFNRVFKRSSTSDPFNNQEDSLFVAQLMGSPDIVDQNSVDSERKHISVAKNSMPSERSFVQRLKVRESQQERQNLHTQGDASKNRQAEVDSVLSIAETNQPSIQADLRQNITLNPMIKGRLDMVYTAATSGGERRKFSHVAHAYGGKRAINRLETQGGPRNKYLYRGKLVEQVMQTRNRQLHTRGIETTRHTAPNESVGTSSEFYSTHFGGAGLGSPPETSTMYRLRQRRIPPYQDSEISGTGSVTRRNIDMQMNNTGRSIKGGGGLGRSNSPCSQSGMDPNLLRGKGSQLNFEIRASEKQIESITRSFNKLRDIRFGKSPPSNIYSAYQASQDFNKPAHSSSRLTRSNVVSPNPIQEASILSNIRQRMPSLKPLKGPTALRNSTAQQNYHTQRGRSVNNKVMTERRMTTII